MPILTISDLVLGEISQMQFRFGGTPADVVEYSDGGRKASGQAITVDGLEAVTENWVSFDPGVVPTADAAGVVPEFYGPPGIIALRVDFGFGPVVLRADAATLHKELRDLLLARLSQLQVDNESFRTAVTGELDAMRAEIDSAVTTALADVEELINTSLGDTIQDAVDAKLATDLAPTLEAAVTDALTTDIPPLITAEVNAKVPPAVTAGVAGLQEDIDVNAAAIAENGVSLANTRYELDATKARATSLENRMTSVEAKVTIQTFTRTATISGMHCTLKIQRLMGIAIAKMSLTSAVVNGGPTGWNVRGSMSLPASLLPVSDASTLGQAKFANGQPTDDARNIVGLRTDGQVFTQCSDSWNTIEATLVYFTNY